jgi:hypothetical protein
MATVSHQRPERFVRDRYKIVDRRPGDIASCYADVSKAERELGGWKATRSIDEVCETCVCVCVCVCGGGGGGAHCVDVGAFCSTSFPIVARPLLAGGMSVAISYV